MNIPIIEDLSKNRFTDLMGLFTLRKADVLNFTVPLHFRINNKLGCYRGKRIQLLRLYKANYGDIIQVIKIIKDYDLKIIKKISLDKFNEKSKEFYSIPTWTAAKKEEGQKLFNFLRSYNPIYFQKDKDWKKQYIKSSKTGDYFILHIQNEKGVLKTLNNHKCLIITTYNEGYKNAFMAIPLV